MFVFSPGRTLFSLKCSFSAVFSFFSLLDHLTGCPHCDSLLISEGSLRLNMLHIPACSPLLTAVVLGSLNQSRSGEIAAKCGVKHLLFLWLWYGNRGTTFSIMFMNCIHTNRDSQRPLFSDQVHTSTVN